MKLYNLLRKLCWFGVLTALFLQSMLLVLSILIGKWQNGFYLIGAFDLLASIVLILVYGEIFEKLDE